MSFTPRTEVSSPTSLKYVGKKIKLPRRRKKAYIKTNGSLTYMSSQIVSEMMIQDGDTSQNWFKFPELKMVGRKCVTIFNW